MSSYLVKEDILYKMYKDKWGTHPRNYINFSKLLKYNVKLGTIEKLHANYDNVLCNESDTPLPDHIQEIYKEWTIQEIDHILIGDSE